MNVKNTIYLSLKLKFKDLLRLQSYKLESTQALLLQKLNCAKLQTGISSGLTITETGQRKLECKEYNRFRLQSHKRESNQASLLEKLTAQV